MIARIAAAVAAAIAAVGALPLSAASAKAAPLFWLYPDITPPNSDVAAFGRAFCGAPGCSAVTIRVEARVVATGVRVAADGTFSAVVRIIEPMGGPYRVLARQTLADGSPLEVAAGVRVGSFGQSSSPARTGTTARPPAATPPAGPSTSAPASAPSQTSTPTGGPHGAATTILAAGKRDSGAPLWPFLVGGLAVAGAAVAVVVIQRQAGNH